MFQDRRLKPHPVLLLVFAVAAFLMGYGLALAPFSFATARNSFEHLDPSGGDVIFWLMVMAFTGFLFAVFTRSVTRVPLWSCLVGAAFASLFGVFFTIFIGMVGIGQQAFAQSVVRATVYGLVVVLVATPFTVITVFSGVVGYALVELLSQRILRPYPEI